MQLERLRIFIAVAEREHVTAAAKALNLTQSAVSNALAALEAEYDVRLFDRVGRNVVLNSAGRAFLPEARAVLSRAHMAAGVLTDLSSLRKGSLSVFASQTIATAWLPQRLVAFHKAYPGIALDVSIGNTEEVSRAVSEGLAEIGLVEGVVDNALLSLETVGFDRLTILVRPDHPWSSRAVLRGEDLLSTPWVLREAGSGTRSTLEAALRAAGADPDALSVTMVLPTNEMVLAAAEAGAGATALSEHIARRPLAAGTLVTAPFSLGERPFVMLRHGDRYRSRASDAFARLCREPGAPPPSPQRASTGRPS